MSYQRKQSSEWSFICEEQLTCRRPRQHSCGRIRRRTHRTRLSLGRRMPSISCGDAPRESIGATDNFGDSLEETCAVAPPAITSEP